ncbi:beta-galactosidase [Agaribacter marinus]|uniref:Hydrolase n=1 Tax=Agaribacter marinus TaxID=1431249 RepID=A0AA37WH38_9ALTE|nr:beta-galactosidase [Agaribacter marinus]GLR69543.1 hydrolase [Agaribacter marinus]
MKYKYRKLGFLLSGLTLAVLAGCGGGKEESNATDSASNERMLFDFENGQVDSAVQLEHGVGEVISEGNNKKYSITLNSTDNYKAAFKFKPSEPWDWSKEGDFAFAVDIENPKDKSIFFYVTATDASGKTHNRSLSIAENSSGTYYLELAGQDLDVETGLRSNPKSWITDYTPIIWRWGVKKIDLENIASIEFKLLGVLEDKHVIIDNARIIKPEAVDENYLVGLVDEFGQNAKMDFVGKVDNLEDLIKVSAEEQSQLRKTPLDGRSKFNGWADGPKLEGTGYFSTAKVDGKWWLVDPEGYLFFSNGIANVRMANTSTMTGYDFDSSLIRQRDANDKTPEDSIGLNQVSKAAVPTRHATSELRANMFEWLPSYDDELGLHFGYRRETFMGALEKGETYSFYQANLARKYQSNDPEVFMEKWRTTTVDRMLTWGFTSFGNWVDPSYYQMDRFPYFANGWIIGDFKTLSSGNDLWSALPDVFDPVFKERALATAEQIGKEVQNNPWCVGVFVDNEKSWGMENPTSSEINVKAVYGIAINALSLDASKSPTKTVYMNILKEKYDSIEAVNASWNTSIESWDSLASGVVLEAFNEALTEDLSHLLYVYAEQYFDVVKNAVKKYLPNHMYMGARFADWGMTPEVRAAAAKHVDVMSYNYYKEGISDNFWHFLKDIDMPSVIGEFHNGSQDSGMLNPGLIHAPSQQDRGRRYKDYMYGVIDNPYFVGAHWFQYNDGPLTGRAYDGENYNVGFVSVADVPYAPLVKAAKEVNADLYKRRAKK